MDNESRRAAAQEAISAHNEAIRQEEEAPEQQQLDDLLTNLRHWAKHHGVRFDKALMTSKMHFDAER